MIKKADTLFYISMALIMACAFLLVMCGGISEASTRTDFISKKKHLMAHARKGQKFMKHNPEHKIILRKK